MWANCIDVNPKSDFSCRYEQYLLRVNAKYIARIHPLTKDVLLNRTPVELCSLVPIPKGLIRKLFPTDLINM